MTTTSRLNVKDSTAALRAGLRLVFPGVKFSVRGSRGTGYGWVTVSWTDGPTEQAVRAISDTFEAERFNGMTDMMEPTSNTRHSLSGVNHQRDYSDERVAEIVALVKTTTDGEKYVDHNGTTVFQRYPHTSDREIACMWLAKVAL